jgi:hypothetical protein
MMKQSQHQDYRWIIGLLVVFMFLLSCESRDRFIGTYKAAGQESIFQREIIIELRENGDGLWKVGTDETKGTFGEVHFVWHIKRGDLRVHTRAGGVIIGKIDRDTIRITLPGSKVLTFRKTH